MVATQDLVLLGLLKERPLHGYELKQIVADRLAQVASIPPGTLYYTLKKLEKRGWVSSSVQREGNRPERQVFALTDAGDTAFQQLLSEALNLDERAYYVFDAALYFFPYLDEADLASAIERKVERLGQFRSHVEDLGKSHPGRWPIHLEALRNKAALLTSALDEWYRGLGAALKDRRQRRGPTTEPKPGEKPEAIPT